MPLILGRPGTGNQQNIPPFFSRMAQSLKKESMG
jgi:hypothetical protein